MSTRIIYCFLLAAAAACSGKKESADGALSKTEQAGLYRMQVQAVPEKGGLVFRTRLTLDRQRFEEDKDLVQNLQYGLDSAFYLVSKGDTIWPGHVLPVANGQLLNPEFLVSFDPAGIEQVMSVQFKTNLKGLSDAKGRGVSFDTKTLKSLY
jgi:hypothetical protein